MLKKQLCALFFVLLVSWSFAEERKIDENCVVLAADCHVTPGKIHRKNNFEADTLENFRKLIQDVLAMDPRPACVIFPGDMVEQPSAEAYALLKTELKPWDDAKIPYYFVLGNHDNAVRFFKAFPDHKAKTTATGTLAYRIDLPRASFLTLETTNPKEGFYGRIEPMVKNWLQAEMARTPEKPVFIVGHHDMNFAKNFPNLASIPNFVGWINGHWHTYSQITTSEGVRVFWLPSCGFMDWGENPVVGYEILTLGEDSFTLRLVTHKRDDKRNGKVVTGKYAR